MIHPSAYIDPTARLGRDVTVGPNSFVGAGAELGDGCVLHNNVTVGARTRCGQRNVFFPQSIIGMEPQDLKYKGGPTRVEIGDDNVFRELVTIHSGTEVAGGVTRVGSHGLFMVGVHIAHDCEIGNDCIIANQVQLAGHICIEDRVTIGGLSAIHHFTTVGRMAYVGGMTRIVADVPPYMVCEGNPCEIRGYNRVAMRRWNCNEAAQQAMRDAYLGLFGKRAEAAKRSVLERIEGLAGTAAEFEEVAYLCNFLKQSLHDGVYGRQREIHRRDTDEDRRKFYEGGRAGGTS